MAQQQQYPHATSDSSSSSSSGSGAGGGSMDDDAAAAAAAAAADTSAAASAPHSSQAPRPALLRMLAYELSRDPTLSAIRRGLPPLPMPPEPPALQQMQQMQQMQQTALGAAAAAETWSAWPMDERGTIISTGAGSGASGFSLLLSSSAAPAPLVSAEAVRAAAMVATAADASGGVPADAPFPMPPQHLDAVHAANSSGSAVEPHPTRLSPTAAAAFASASAIAAPPSNPAASLVEAETAAAAADASVKNALIGHMLTLPPFSSLGGAAYRSDTLRRYLHDLPHAHLFQLAWHWRFYCTYILGEQRDSRGRPVSRSTRAYIERWDSNGKGHGMRPFTFLTRLLQSELQNDGATSAQLGVALTKTGMDKWISEVLSQLVGRFLLPATLMAEFHLVIRDAQRHPSAAVTHLQQALHEAGIDVEGNNLKWSLIFLLEKACQLQPPPASLIAQLCELLHSEEVHVPMQPAATIKEFVSQLLSCNMLVEYSDMLAFERWLWLQGHPLVQLPHLLDQQRATLVMAHTVSSMSSSSAGAGVASSTPSHSAPPAGAHLGGLQPAPGGVAADIAVPATDPSNRSQSAPLLMHAAPMPASFRTPSDQPTSPPPLLASPPVLVLSTALNLDFDVGDLDELMRPSDPSHQ